MTGWLRVMRSCFEQGKIREYWESDLELEKWFDPAFEEFVNKELTATIKSNSIFSYFLPLSSKTSFAANKPLSAAGNYYDPKRIFIYNQYILFSI
jgi:hypothetical protein